MDIVHTSLNDDPENPELLALKAELDEMINMISESIADIAPAKRPTAAAAAAAPAKAPTPPAPEKWSRENHPAFKKQAQKEKDRAEAAAAATAAATATAAAEASITYAVNDTVLAKWVSGDKGFYPARIMAVTGSSTQPIYSVKFKTYDNVETLRAKDIKPASNKRKADGSGTGADVGAGAGAGVASPTTPGTPSFPSLNSTATTTNNGIVLQSAPSVYPQAEQKPEDGDKPAKKFKKIKATKELEKGKNKWQEFNAKGKFGKSQKKDSMFRTPDGVHGRGTYLLPL